MGWKVITDAINWEIFPADELEMIRDKVATLAEAGYTYPEPAPPIDLPDGLQQRNRTFTTLESAEDYANLINNLPSDTINVIAIEEV